MKRGEETSEYISWRGMKSRCDNPRDSAYARYGGRGISYDPRWVSFQAFLDDLGLRPGGFTLDRIDNNLGYSKANCRWASRSEQRMNQRPRQPRLAPVGTISSAEFRKTYPRLTEEVLVTANGRTIGLWRPNTSMGRFYEFLAAGQDGSIAVPFEIDPTISPMSDKARALNPQAERDAILRKINKGG